MNDLPQVTATEEQIRVRLLEVLDACPVEECNPEDCPLYELRRLEHPERVRWLNALKQDDLEYLAAYHYVCQHIKMLDVKYLPDIPVEIDIEHSA